MVAEADVRSFKELTNQDVSLFTYKDGKPLADFPQPGKSHYARFRRRKVVSYLDQQCLGDLLLLGHAPIFTKRALDLLNGDLGRLLRNDEEVTDCAILAQAFGQFKMGNNSVALILSWLVIETYLSEVWLWALDNSNRTYPDGKRRIGSKRMYGLKNGSNYTASVMANFLELMGILPFETFDRIDEVRRVRNRVVHDRHECSIEEAGLALRVVKDIIKQKSGVEISLDLSQFTST